MRGLRNNNPLNIRRTADRWQGAAATQTDKSFVQFSTMAYGYRAAWKILDNYWLDHYWWSNISAEVSKSVFNYIKWYDTLRILSDTAVVDVYAATRRKIIINSDLIFGHSVLYVHHNNLSTPIEKIIFFSKLHPSLNNLRTPFIYIS